MDDPYTGPEDDMFELLANRRRRIVLNYLATHDGSAHLRELSRAVVVDETGTPPEAVGSDSIHRVYVALYQTHVPELEQYGLVEYDDAERVVTLRDHPGERISMSQNRRRARRLLAISYLVLGVVLSAVVTLYVVQPIAVPRSIVAAVTIGAVAAFTVLSIRHYYRTRVSSTAARSLDDLAP